ncbi:hypothetical protein [Sporosarcina sp. FA9]|uniref:hypothetical protein n=1 Tax=Sporosarcina sp. FA9 TaxID=3413030 RepID=UPI003F657D5D
MKKTPLIDASNYFKESEKVIQIVKDRQEDIHRSLSEKRKLEIAKESLETASSRESFDALNNMIKDLEFEIKHGNDVIPAIPEKYQNKIAFNRVHEEEQIDLEIARQKELLLEVVNGLEESLINTLQNIEGLEKRKLIGKKVDILLDGKITKDNNIHNVFYHANGLSFSAEHIHAKEAHEKGEKLFDALKKIATAPKQPNGINKPSIFDRILGGKQ